MTRLIDAERLKQAFMAEYITTKLFDTAMDLSDALIQINNAPTVDAIPIEYIREHMNGFYDHGYNEFGSALEALIMDWEEEND